MIAAEKKSEKPISVSREFQDNFRKVCQHYGFTEEEIEDVKEAIRRDYENAKVCYAAIAADIDKEVRVFTETIITIYLSETAEQELARIKANKPHPSFQYVAVKEKSMAEKEVESAI